jgi:hypothetical protein
MSAPQATVDTAERGTMTTTPSEPSATSGASPVVEPAAYQAPMPTPGTVRKRTNVPLQAYRFGAVSIKMMRMILRSHG